MGMVAYLPGFEPEVIARDAGFFSRPFAVSWGMGVNSTAMLIGLSDRGIRPDLIMAADTGGEKKETYAFIDIFRAWLAKVGFPDVHLVQNDGVHRTLEQESLTNNVLPSKVYGFAGCSDKYKMRPQNKLVKAWPPAIACWERGEKVCRAIGYDFDEDHRGKKLEDDLYHYWHPLVEWQWGRKDCLEAIKRTGLQIPPKSACFFCPSSKKHEVLWLYENHRDLFDRGVAMERNSEEYNQNVKGLGRKWSWQELVSLPMVDQEKLTEPPDIACMCDDGEPEPRSLF